MNRLFGLSAPAGAAARCAAAVRWLALHGEPPAELLVSGETLAVGVTHDGGAVLGSVVDGEQALALLGWIHAPAPGLGEGSPLDDPHATARHLLARFRERGAGFLDGLSGHYALALRDGDRLWLARDPAGGRRLFVAEHGGGLVFSSQLAALRGLLGADLRVDRGLEDFHLAYEFLPANRTVFRGVTGLAPGTLLECRAGATTRHAIAAPRPRPDAQLTAADLGAGESAVGARLARVFARCVEDQVPSGPRVAVLLGGFDSALVAASLCRLGKQVETFSFHYEDERYNQAHTEELAALLGIRHHWVPITPDTLREGILRYAFDFNQPVSQTHYMLNTALACRAMRERGFVHCLTGDGCDGLFLGYPTVHQRAKLIERLSSAAFVLRPAEGLARSAWLERRLGHPYRIARNVLRILRREMPARAHVAACTLDDFSLSLLRRGPAPVAERDGEEILAELARGLEEVAPVRLAYLGKGVVGLNRNKLEGCAALSGVVLNTPFLHPDMIAFARSLPDALSRPEHATRARLTGKYALMRMAEDEGLLPRHIIEQPKRSPVTAPVDAWYHGELRSLLLERMDDLPFEVDRRHAESLVAPHLAETLFRRHVGISRYTSNAIQMLVTYAAFTALAAAADPPPPPAAT